jgi:hypothetical protein
MNIKLEYNQYQVISQVVHADRGGRTVEHRELL